MYLSHVFDVAGPEFLVVIGVSLLLGGAVFMVLVTLVEASMMALVKWDTFRRCLWPSFLMNFATTLLGVILLLGGYFWQLTLGFMFVGFVVSVTLEWGILMFFKRNTWLRTLTAALVANFISYIFLTGYAWFSGVI